MSSSDLQETLIPRRDIFGALDLLELKKTNVTRITTNVEDHNTKLARDENVFPLKMVLWHQFFKCFSDVIFISVYCSRICCEMDLYR